MMAARARQSTPWSDLQPDLLGLVLSRLPSLADRVRLRAVCHRWRRGARLAEPLPPPLPWVMLHDATFVSFPAGETHRVPIPDDDARHCHGSVGKWLFFQDKIDGMCSLMDPLSRDVVQLPQLASFAEIMSSFFKLVLPSSRRVSPDSLFAALITCGNQSTISVGQASTAAASFRVPFETLSDAAFFDGKLYAISHSNKLFVFDIDSSDQGKPRIQSMKCVVDSINGSGTPSTRRVDYDDTYRTYLVESGGRLLQIRRLVRIPSFHRRSKRVRRYRTISFDIFEADLTDSCGQWRPVSNLGGQALFVGTYAESLPASECGAQEDCIYFICDYGHGYYDKSRPFHDCGFFHIGNGWIAPLLPKIAVVPALGNTVCKGRPAWFFHYESIMADATKH